MTGDSSQLRLAFLADDFTGATDALEVLATQGVRVALFARPPTQDVLLRQPDLQAVGLAVASRAMTPEQMDDALPRLFGALRERRPTLIHYKVCSTFDSSPTIGSIGHVIDLGIAALGATIVPVVVGAPSLGRHCVFGNLFARGSVDSEPFRLDRHPSMRRHPVTPMDEADLRVHLSRQTTREIGLIDVLTLERGSDAVRSALHALRDGGVSVAMIDLLLDRHLPVVGSALEGLADSLTPGFIVGSSGVESALCARWRESGTLRSPRAFPPPHDAGPVVVIVGSRSPVSARQRDRAMEAGFARIALDLAACQRSLNHLDDELSRARDATRTALDAGQSVVVEIDDTTAGSTEVCAATIARAARRIVEETRARRLLVAGGDTSGAVASALEVESIEMIATFTRGAPLCRVTAPGHAADGLEVIFKGGQVGDERLFLDARGATASASVNR